MKKNLFGWVIAVIVVAGAVWGFWGMDAGPIEDTNGPDDYSLNTITNENIIKRDIGSLGFKKSDSFFKDGITFSADAFSGVCEIMHTYMLFDSDFALDVSHFEINSGNFMIAVVNNDEIVAVIDPENPSCDLTDINGDVSLVIAGESAEFTFYLPGWFCDIYGITVKS